MRISEFQAGIILQRYQYKSFEPNLVNLAWEIDQPEIVNLLSEANLKLGELNAFSQLIPDVDFFIKMHVFKEGNQSSRIEGTQTTFDEAVQKIEYIQPEKRDDWKEVQNYVQALNEAIEMLEDLPLSSRLFKQTHRILLQGVRGTNKLPGEYRRSQNWIGGTSLSDAVFIPPYFEGIEELMSDLEKFLNSEDHQVPHLIKIAIAHYQFETIHPFLDGNGRIGRLLITLFLVSNKLLVKPTLYMSDYFEKNRAMYYDYLTKVRTQNDLISWLKFFLRGIRITSENAIESFKKIIQLRLEMNSKIFLMGKKTVLANSLMNHLYSHPILDTNEIASQLNVSFSTASRLAENFVNHGILIETTGYKRNRLFSFEAYLALFR